MRRRQHIGIPKPDVNGTGEHAELVRSPRQVLHVRPVRVDYQPALASFDIPHSNGSITRPRDSPPPVIGEQCTIRAIPMASEALYAGTGGEVPYSHLSIPSISPSRDSALPVCTESERPDKTGVAF